MYQQHPVGASFEVPGEVDLSLVREFRKIVIGIAEADMVVLGIQGDVVVLHQHSGGGDL